MKDWEGATRTLPAPVRTLQRALRKVAEAPPASLDTAVTAAAERVGKAPLLHAALRGAWLGHAVHPMLTDFTEGPWMAASFLDLFGPDDSDAAAQRLVGLGLLAAVPTLLSGLVDWSEARGGARRVGLVHAAGSLCATGLYALSYVARRRGGRTAGVALGLAGGVVAYLDGYVGGELSLVARIGTGRRGPDNA